MVTIDPFDVELHDAHILDVDFDCRFQNLRIVVHAPFNEYDNFVEFAFEAVLRMEFETLLALTDDMDHPLEIMGLSRHNGATHHRFLNRILEVETPEESKAAGFSEIFHVTLHTELVHRGFGPKEGLNGIHIVCRRISARPADKKWYGRAVPWSGIPAE